MRRAPGWLQRGTGWLRYPRIEFTPLSGEVRCGYRSLTRGCEKSRGVSSSAIVLLLEIEAVE